ncbi:Fe-S oxidoreductase [Malaciobacter mytili LMG 24559]|uniref:Fe-S oxidoreductase n=1 Tax=Malaciobacter mytili LMG 24559 TaxID=1032238 RepID=A0AAX2AH37_9BACT|nr:(Fe-S)-binding protein [Malaciobacter mytili]AXH13703.1 L-lactate utilization protein LutA [Malaciobacter mytili LMG 24559]RXK16314.1 Fe-S oxidoreductase [Malaciobacter mytili LMG 24559]
MKIGLFIPCFMNELYPDVCMATLKILKKLNLEIDYPMSQTCCGQPMANSGCSKDIETLAKQFVETFKDYDYIVAPSGSCVTMVKEHYAPFFKNNSDYNKVKTSIYEVCEFLHDIIKIEYLDVSFPYKVGIHNSCHGHRMLKLGTPSELNIPYNSKLKNLLSLVKDIEIVTLQREDECCGFGGTFSVTEEDISVAMGKDRIKDHIDSQAQIITGADMSCLMHMDGIINRNKENIKVMHIVEILAGAKYE